jgi:hypothetical protein
MSAIENAIHIAFEKAGYTQIHIEFEDEIWNVSCQDFHGEDFDFDFEVGSDDDRLYFTEINDHAAPVIVEIPEEGFED